VAWIHRALSLRSKITATFTLIVVGGTVASTLIGSRIITTALINPAHVRARQALDAVRTTYDERLTSVRTAVSRAAANVAALGPADRTGPDLLAARLEAMKAEAALDFLGLVTPGGLVIHGDGAVPPSRPATMPPLLSEALAGRVVAGTVVMAAGQLAAEDRSLADRARIAAVPVSGASASSPVDTSAGLVLLAAAPVETGGGRLGAVYGGVLLNRSSEIVDRVKRLCFGDETYRGRAVGTVTIFLGDVRVATNVMTPAGERAIGTRVSAPVAASVLGAGRTWQGRAFVVNDWYVAAYAPLRDVAGKVVGIFYAGVLEAPFLAARTEVMASFLVVCVVGLAVVFALTYLLTRTTIHPLEEMVAATRQIAAGDLSVRVQSGARDEIGALAASFNAMVDALQTMRRELEEWGRTLEVKVQERTDQLVTVQARMAQSEKLASVGRLAAGVAHGINNPLGGILTLTMLALEECGENDPLRGDLQTIVTQTLRCREIVKGLLDFAHQSEGRASEVSVTPIVDSTLSLLERQAIFHNIRTVRQFAEDVPPVFIDPSQLQEVIVNIVLNAVDAMEQNGVLTVETSADPGRTEVRIRITDTGKGIPPDVLPLIFEPFYTTKKVGEGTGLGLAIVHGIVTRAGGRMDVASSPGRTTFTVTLPAAAAAAAAS
jgi:two-component system NtrC family sensor kinase